MKYKKDTILSTSLLDDSVNNDHSIKKVVNMLTENRSQILVPSSNNMFVRTTSRSSIDELFAFFMNNINIDNLYAFLDITNISGIKAVPSIINNTAYELDTLEFKHTYPDMYNVLSSLSEYRDKIIVDISSMWNSKSESFKDTNMFVNMIVRSIISRSYILTKRDTTKDIWLTNELCLDIAYIYGSLFKSNLSYMYDLDPHQSDIVGYIFATYMLNMFITTDRDHIQNMRLEFSDTASKVNTNELIKDVLDDRPISSISDVVKCIAALNYNDRLSTFERSVFLNKSRLYNSNSILSNIACEYAPYWVYLLLSSRSNKFFFKNVTANNISAKKLKDVVKTLTSKNVFANVFE